MSQLLALYVGSLILRSIGIALVAGICSWKVRNVAMRHAIWVAVLGALLLMPAVDYLLPPSWVPTRIQQIAARQPVPIRAVSVRVTDSPPTVSPATAAVSLPVQSKPVDLWVVAAMMYALVALAMFARLTMGYRKLRRLRRTGRPITSSVWEEIVASHGTRWRKPILLESEAVLVPMTVGLVRPAVILPVDWKTWDDWKMRAVLFHELAHVRRVDWSIAVLAATSKCAYWMNPVSWFLERQLSQLAEQASDDATLSNTQSRTRYAEILLEFAVAAQNVGRLMKGGISMAQPNMKARIERALGNPTTGTGIVRIAGWALVTFITAPVIYFAAALQVTSEPVKPPVDAYAAEFGRNPAPKVQAAGPQAGPSPAPATALQLAQSSSGPVVDPRALYQQMEIVKQQLQQAKQTSDEYFQMLHKYNQSIADTSPELPGPSDTNPSQSQLDQLRVNEEMLGRLHVELASLSKLIEEKELTSSSSQIVDSKSKYRVYVTGRVQRPGDFPWDKPLTVLQALALAGGFQDYAKMDAISIIRMNGNASTLIRFNYSEVIRGVNNVQNIYLESGDVVVVP